MSEKYIKIENLSVSKNLLNFINSEVLPGIKIKKKKFWKGFSKYIHELSLDHRVNWLHRWHHQKTDLHDLHLASLGCQLRQRDRNETG